MNPIACQGITPACAGKRLLQTSRKGRTRDHPRVCGEKVIQVVPPAPQVGSPPRVRGKVTPHHRVANDRGITPACAGKRRTTRTSGARYRDHPRVCGEKKKCYTKGGILPGSPPRVRGKVGAVVCGVVYSGITPAYAGKSTLYSGIRRVVLGSPPRMRGKEEDEHAKR